MPRARSRRSSKRGVRLGLELADELARLLRVPLDQVVGEPELHGERDQLLLRAVVDVALEPPALRVLRGDQPLLRGLQVLQPCLERLGQPDVASTSPAWAARSAISFSSDGETGSLDGLRTASAPRSSPVCTTGYTRSMPSICGTDPFGSGIG